MTNESHKYSAWASLDGLFFLLTTQRRLWRRCMFRMLDIEVPFLCAFLDSLCWQVRLS